MGAPRGWYGEEERIRPVESRALERNRILSLPTDLSLYLRDPALQPPPVRTRRDKGKAESRHSEAKYRNDTTPDMKR